MPAIKVLDARADGNLYHNVSNQIRRAIGPNTPTYIGPVFGDTRCGTVRDRDGYSWDWWQTDESIPGTPFFVVKIMPAS